MTPAHALGRARAALPRIEQFLLEPPEFALQFHLDVAPGPGFGFLDGDLAVFAQHLPQFPDTRRFRITGAHEAPPRGRVPPQDRVRVRHERPARPICLMGARLAAPVAPGGVGTVG